MPQLVSNTVQVHISYFDKDIENYKFLALKRASTELVYPDIWQVITGTIEPNELAYRTALRETFEETGLIPLKMWNIPKITSFYDYTSDTINLSPVFGILVQSSEIFLSNEHIDFEWLSIDEVVKKVDLPSHKICSQIFLDYVLLTPNNKIYEIKL